MFPGATSHATGGRGGRPRLSTAHTREGPMTILGHRAAEPVVSGWHPTRGRLAGRTQPRREPARPHGGRGELDSGPDDVREIVSLREPRPYPPRSVSRCAGVSQSGQLPARTPVRARDCQVVSSRRWAVMVSDMVSPFIGGRVGIVVCSRQGPTGLADLRAGLSGPLPPTSQRPRLHSAPFAHAD